jgi:hypothetical protein
MANETKKTVVVVSEETNYSGIGYKFGIDCTEAERDYLASLGLTIISQRSPAAEADRVLGYAKGQISRKYSRADYEKENGSKWTRDLVTFTPETAQEFERILREQLGSTNAKPFPMSINDVSVFAQSANGAMAEAVRSIRMFEQWTRRDGLAKLGFVHDETMTCPRTTSNGSQSSRNR